MAPARSRPSAAPERQNRVPLNLPTYEPPQHPLNATAKRALETLPRNHRVDGLKNKQRLANNYLTQAAADINDRLQGKTMECEKFKKRRLEKQGSQEDHEEMDRTLYNMRQATDSMTDRLEESVRKIIDASAEVEGIERVLKELHANAINPRSNGLSTQSTAATTQINQGQRRRTNGSDDGGSDYEDETILAGGDSESTMEALKQKIAEHREAYQAMSMAHRYASHNDYVGFKKIVHDAHYPEDSAPPMPHASTWFANEPDDTSGPMTRGAAAGAADSIEDDDLTVASERISIKCPITLLTMIDPVTSQKCPHSFEKTAILDMIRLSDEPVPGTGRHGPKAIKCPVCTVLLTADDLKEDQVLIRKINRIKAALNAQNEESSDEDDTSRRQRPSGQQSENISSSPATTRTPGLKNERQSQAPGLGSRQVSMVPNTQLQGVSDEEQERIGGSAANDHEDEDEMEE